MTDMEDTGWPPFGAYTSPSDENQFEPAMSLVCCGGDGPNKCNAAESSLKTNLFGICRTRVFIIIYLCYAASM